MNFARRLLHRSLIPLGLGIYLSAPATAQDRTITVREQDVLPKKGELDVLPDGGCLFTAYAEVVAPSVEPKFVRATYNVSGQPLCTTGKSKIVTAAKKDLSVGNGADP